MYLTGFRAQPGEHCETTALRNMLGYEGVLLSEPMLFGLGSGIDFQYWPSPDPRKVTPTLSGRIEPGRIAADLCHALDVDLVVAEAESPGDARDAVVKLLADGCVVGLKVDIHYLGYFSASRHFASHYVALYGMDESYAAVVDTRQQGGTHRLPVHSLAAARNSREGFMPSRNLYMYVDRVPAELANLPGQPVKPAVVWRAIADAARNALTDRGPHRGPQGMVTTAEEMRDWHRAFDDPKTMVTDIGTFWRYAGTGGANFRRLYAAFLAECEESLRDGALAGPRKLFSSIESEWDEVIDTLIGYRRDGDRARLQHASDRLKALADAETSAFGSLLAIARDRIGGRA